MSATLCDSRATAGALAHALWAAVNLSMDPKVHNPNPNPEPRNHMYTLLIHLQAAGTVVRSEVPTHLCNILELGNLESRSMAAAAWRNLCGHPGTGRSAGSHTS